MKTRPQEAIEVDRVRCVATEGANSEEPDDSDAKVARAEGSVTIADGMGVDVFSDEVVNLKVLAHTEKILDN